ncbi:30S ribosomal protein S16 [Candidatus Berkelbacteria bacterium]|nr:30S ribosomal protein S16 [Candidatus Berkelbacteria bacterium]
MLKIRLRRTGKRHQPYYRLVLAEHTAPVTGKFVTILGHYNPRSKELVVDTVKTIEWLNLGAQASNTVARLLLGHGLKHKALVVHTYPHRASKSEQPAAVTPSDSGEAPSSQTHEGTTAESPDDDAGAPANESDVTTATETQAQAAIIKEDESTAQSEPVDNAAA